MAKLKKLVYSIASFAIVLGSVMTFSATTAMAAPAYDYQLISQSAYPATLAAGATTNVYIEVKNTGTATWGSNVRLGAGSSYGAANQQRDYNSEFANSDWLSVNRPAGMSNGGAVSNILPGWVVRFQFNIKAPTTNGTYKAYFTPVADGSTWMKDIGIFWQLTVSGGSNNGGGDVIVPVTGALNVSIASDTAGPNSIIAASATQGTAEGAQALIPMAKFNFTAPTSGDAKVTTLKIKRTGLASDSDIASAYIYDGNTRLAEYTSMSAGLITFVNPNGLFTVGAGGTKGITVKIDLANGTGASKTIGLSINAATDVVSNVATIAGSFPVSGSMMTTATVDDLGTATIVAGTSPATIDPGATNQDLWKFTIAAANQQLSVKYIRLTEVGNISTGDLANLKLSVSGTQIGSAVAGLASDGSVVFDLSSTPLVINSGVTKTIQLSGDVMGGTNRTFYFSIQKISDVVVIDNNYGIYLKPNKVDAFTVIKAASTTLINVGSATLTINSTSPSGNIALGATNVTLAKFDIRAAGEPVKVTTLIVETVLTVDDGVGLNNGKIFVDGVQLGTTTDLDSDSTDDAAFTDTETLAANTGDDDTTFSLGNSLIIPAGTTKTIEIVADILRAAGTALTGNNVITVSLGGIVAQGQNSLSTVTFGSATSRNLTAVSGAVTSSANLGFGAGTAAAPTGVVGKTVAKIGSFTLAAGTGEGVSVSQFVLSDGVADGCAAGNAGGYLGCNFQNLTVKHGSDIIGNPVGSLSSTAANALTFTPATAITIAAGQQYILDVYADILSGAVNTAVGPFVGVLLDSVTATGVSTSGTADDANQRTGQTVYITAKGALVISIDPSSPDAAQLVMGATDQILGAFKFSPDTSEDINISTVKIRDTISGETNGAINYKLFDGTTQIGETVVGIDGSADVTFSINNYVRNGVTGAWVIPAGVAKILTVKASINTSPNTISADTHIISIEAAASVTSTGAGSGQSITATGFGAGSVDAASMSLYRTLLTIDKDTSVNGGALVPGVTRVLQLTLTANARDNVTFAKGGSDQLTFDITEASVDALADAYTISLKKSDGTVLDSDTIDPDTDTAVVFNFSTAALTVPAGGSVTLYVDMDLSGYIKNGDIFRLNMANDAGQVWNDGTTDVADSLLKNLPISGGTYLRSL